jgi:hypothetical protein
MSIHFQTAVKASQRYFLANRRAVNVQNMTGIVVKCDVKLSDQDPDHYVNVWPHDDGQMREGIPLTRGTFAILLNSDYLVIVYSINI